VRVRSQARRQGGLRARLREAARQAVLDSAEAVFCERGIAAAGVEEIAERAGVSVGTIYNYFGDRAGLLAAILEGERQQLIEGADASLAATERRPFRERLDSLLDVTLSHLREHHRLFTLLMEDELAYVRAAVHRHRCMTKEVMERVEGLIQSGINDGTLAPEHGTLYPALVTGMVKGVFMGHLLKGDDAPPPDVRGATIADLFLDGARRHA
jgi:AcrR family transcriptional regulator